MARLCCICHKPLGLRRERQGVRRHPRCKGSPTRGDLEGAIGQTSDVVSAMSRAPAEGELGELFRAAAEQAEGVLADLKQLRGYLASDRTRP